MALRIDIVMVDEGATVAVPSSIIPSNDGEPGDSLPVHEIVQDANLSVATVKKFLVLAKNGKLTDTQGTTITAVKDAIDAIYAANY